MRDEREPLPITSWGESLSVIACSFAFIMLLPFRTILKEAGIDAEEAQHDRPHHSAPNLFTP